MTCAQPCPACVRPHWAGNSSISGTAGEQMLYAIGDPGAYLLPDVSCDFRQVQMVQMVQTGDNQVRVSGALGKGMAQILLDLPMEVPLNWAVDWPVAGPGCSPPDAGV